MNPASVSRVCWYGLVCLLMYAFLVGQFPGSYTGDASITSAQDRKCTRFFYTETVRHPKKDCSEKVVLMSRCAGRCDFMSSADPVVGFRSILKHPFRYRCSSCQDQTSMMKAVRLRCRRDEPVYAVYRYITQCSCAPCKSGPHKRLMDKNE